MAVRPLVTTGVALLSAGALVAGTPALFVPRDEITVAASTAEAPAHRTMTAAQISLVALSLEGALGSFLDGYGGYYYQGYVPAPTPGYVLSEDGVHLLDPDEDTPPDTALVGPDGKPLYRDVDGHLVAATVGDMGNVQFYDAAGNKVNENFYDPGNCSATGAMCHDGFTGLAYYLSDNVLPLDVFDNIFFEAGATEFAYLGSVVAASIVDAFDPTQRLQLSKRVDEFFGGGAATVVGSILNDNLPDGSFAQDLSNSFFFGYGDATGITAAVTYIVDTVRAVLTPEAPSEGGDTFSLLSAQEETAAKTEAEPDSVTSTKLPNLSKLLSLPTNAESPLKKLVDKLEAPAESKLVKTLDLKAEDTTVDETAEGGTETVTPVVEVSNPATPEVKAPKLPELKLPEVKLPEIKLPQREIEAVDADEAAASTETATTTATGTGTGTETKGTSGTGAETKSGTGSSLVRDSLVAKPGRKSTERKKSAGEKFVENATKNLEKAFKATPKTKAGADSHEKAKDGNANTHANANGDSGDKDKKSDK